MGDGWVGLILMFDVRRGAAFNLLKSCYYIRDCKGFQQRGGNKSGDVNTRREANTLRTATNNFKFHLVIWIFYEEIIKNNISNFKLQPIIKCHVPISMHKRFLCFVQYQEMILLLVLFLTHSISLLVNFVSPLQSDPTNRPIRSLLVPSAVFLHQEEQRSFLLMICLSCMVL